MAKVSILFKIDGELYACRVEEDRIKNGILVVSLCAFDVILTNLVSIGQNMVWWTKDRFDKILFAQQCIRLKDIIPSFKARLEDQPQNGDSDLIAELERLETVEDPFQTLVDKLM